MLPPIDKFSNFYKDVKVPKNHPAVLGMFIITLPCFWRYPKERTCSLIQDNQGAGS